MLADLSTLPNDLDALKAMVVARDVELMAERAQVATLKAQLSERSVEIEHLKLLIAKLKKQQYGRKSEKLDRQIEQLELKLEELQTDEGAAALNTPARLPRKSEGGRKPLPEHLEREDALHTPDETAAAPAVAPSRCWARMSRNSLNWCQHACA